MTRQHRLRSNFTCTKYVNVTAVSPKTKRYITKVTKTNMAFINILKSILSLIIYRLQQFDNKCLDYQTGLNYLFGFFLQMIYLLQKITLSEGSKKSYLKSNFNFFYISLQMKKILDKIAFIFEELTINSSCIDIWWDKIIYN